MEYDLLQDQFVPNSHRKYHNSITASDANILQIFQAVLLQEMLVLSGSLPFHWIMLLISILCPFISHPYFVCAESDPERGSFMAFLLSPVFEEYVFPRGVKYV